MKKDNLDTNQLFKSATDIEPSEQFVRNVIRRLPQDQESKMLSVAKMFAPSVLSWSYASLLILIAGSVLPLQNGRIDDTSLLSTDPEQWFIDQLSNTEDEDQEVIEDIVITDA